LPTEPAVTESSAPANCVKREGHGRLAHAAYTNAIEHLLAWCMLTVTICCNCMYLMID